MCFGGSGGCSRKRIGTVMTDLGAIVGAVEPNGLPRVRSLEPLSTLLEHMNAVSSSASPALGSTITFARVIVGCMTSNDNARSVVRATVDHLGSTTKL